MASDNVHDSNRFVIRSAHEAVAQGLTRFFTGKPCRNGHLSERYVLRGICVECVYASNDKHRAKCGIEQWRAKMRESMRRQRADNPEKFRRQKQIEDHSRRLAAAVQRVAAAGRPKSDHCEICGERGRIVFDHCHKTGVFRGWLCGRCNRALGQVKDSIERLSAMIEYLKKFQ